MHAPVVEGERVHDVCKALVAKVLGRQVSGLQAEDGKTPECLAGMHPLYCCRRQVKSTPASAVAARKRQCGSLDVSRGMSCGGLSLPSGAGSAQPTQPRHRAHPWAHLHVA